MTEQDILTERRKTQSFEVNDMNLSNSELIKLAYEIKLMFQELENKMLKKSDVAEMMDKQIFNHKTECELCKADYLTIENCYPEWLKCQKLFKDEKEKESDEQLKKINKYWDIAKKIAILTAMLFSGASISSVIEFIKGLG